MPSENITQVKTDSRSDAFKSSNSKKLKNSHITTTKYPHDASYHLLHHDYKANKQIHTENCFSFVLDDDDSLDDDNESHIPYSNNSSISMKEGTKKFTVIPSYLVGKNTKGKGNLLSQISY